MSNVAVALAKNEVVRSHQLHLMRVPPGETLTARTLTPIDCLFFNIQGLPIFVGRLFEKQICEVEWPLG